MGAACLIAERGGCPRPQPAPPVQSAGPMKFSYCIIPTQNLRDIGDQVEDAEAWGADHVWIPDEAFMRDPYVVLGSLATRTSRIGLGVGIANPYTRHPMQLARAIATLSDLRNGNLIFGIGAGLKSTRSAIGAPEGDFVETTRDCITVIKRLLAGDRVTYKGPVFALDAARLEVRPSFAIPIFVASTHKAAFEMAGAIADGAIVGNVADADAMRTIVSWVQDGAHAAGHDKKDLTIVAWNIVVATSEPQRAYDLIRAMVARSVAIAHREVRQLLGIDQSRWQAIHSAVRGDASPVTADLVPNDLIDKLAIVGSVDDCVRRLHELEAVGAHMIGVRTTTDLLRELDWTDNVRALHFALSGAGDTTNLERIVRR